MVGREGFTRRRRLVPRRGSAVHDGGVRDRRFRRYGHGRRRRRHRWHANECQPGHGRPRRVHYPFVGFTLTCAQKKHVDLSETVTIEFRAVGSGSAAPSGGSLTASNTSIGPVPASWPDDEANCPSTLPVLAAAPSTVTLTAPARGRHLLVHRAVPHRRVGTDRHGRRQQLGRHGSGSESVTYTLTVPSKQAQTITFPAIADRSSAIRLRRRGERELGLAVAYDAVGDCTVSAAGIVHIVAAGTCIVTASQGGSDLQRGRSGQPQLQHREGEPDDRLPAAGQPTSVRASSPSARARTPVSAWRSRPLASARTTA